MGIQGVPISKILQALMNQSILLVLIGVLFLWSCPNLPAEDRVSEMIRGMTLEQKVGQLICLGFQGQKIQARDIAHFQKIRPGGVVFYGRNFKDAAGIPPLISRIHSISGENKLPLFLAIDQEGGLVHRIRGNYYRPPSAPAIGAANSEELARNVGLAVGSSLGGLGININLAPVLDMPADLLTSPMTLRSFGDHPQTVAKLGTAYIRGLQDAGLLSAVKHFPGIGRSREDSHFKTPHIGWKTNGEKENDLLPFREAIRNGVDMVMVGHTIAEPGDGQNPVSLSFYWMEEVLRKEIGFKGLVIVDNIEMKAIQDLMSIPEAAVQSFKAGADIVMVSHERKNQEAVFDALTRAIQRGEISSERLHQSLRRIIEAKMKIRSNQGAAAVGQQLKEVAEAVAENSVAVIHRRDAPPIKVSKEKAVLYVGYHLTLFQALQDIFQRVEILNTPLAQYIIMKPEVDLQQFLKPFYFLLIDADYPDARQIIAASNDLGKEYVVCSHPLNIQKTLDKLQPKRVMVLFENSRAHTRAAVQIIRGIKGAKGKLPFRLELPETYTYPTTDR